MCAVDKKRRYKILVKGTSEKLKPAELLKINTTANPISDKHIHDMREEKRTGKVINSQVRNQAKMTPDAAKAAVQTLKQDEPKKSRSTSNKITIYASSGVINRGTKNGNTLYFESIE